MPEYVPPLVALSCQCPGLVLLAPAFKQFPHPLTSHPVGLELLKVPPVANVELVAYPLCDDNTAESPLQIVEGIAVTGVGLMLGITLIIVEVENAIAHGLFCTTALKMVDCVMLLYVWVLVVLAIANQEIPPVVEYSHLTTAPL